MTTPETCFQIAVDKTILYQNIKYYKDKEVWFKDNEDANSMHFVKARPQCLFKHELEALKHKFELMTLDGYAIKRFYNHEVGEKPPLDDYNNEVRHCY